MDVAVRAIAVFLEVAVLAALAYCILNCVRLILFDFGVRKSAFGKPLVIAFIAVGFIVVLFFVSHLVSFYPRT